MKVNGSTDPSQLNANLQAASAAEQARAAQAASGNKAAGQVAAPAPTGDQATLSSQGRVLQKAHAALRDVPEVRNDKVEQAKAAIDQGKYKLDLPALAKRLLKLL
jgi:flagellar biosynthesis anti-sigma factor FlgM